MQINLKSISYILLIIDLLIILPLLFFLKGHIWIDLYFIFWYLIFLEIWIVFFNKFKKGVKKIPEKNREDFLLSMILFLCCFIGLSFSYGSARPAQDWFPWIWIIIKISITIVLALIFLSKFTILAEKQSSNLSKLPRIVNNYFKKIASVKMKKRAVIPLLCFLLLFQTLFFYPLVVTPLMPIIAESNIGELNRITNDLIMGYQDDENKTISILKWFDRFEGNMYNTWAPPAIQPISSKNIYFSIAIGNPYFPITCVRNNGDENPLWILTSRCGNCGEHCLLFTEMAIAANLTVRRIHVNGIDHKWNEIYINGDWIIADATWVVYNDGEDGYDVDSNEYEKSQGQFVYVYATYPYQNKQNEDVTQNYTELTIVNISTVDLSNKPISNVTIKVNAYYDGKKIDTGLRFNIDNNGKYQLKIGGGTIEFECIDKDKEIHNNSKYEVYENQFKEIVLSVE